MMGYLGTGGLQLSEIEEGISNIQHELNAGESYGINLLHNPNNPEMEERTVDLFLKKGVKNIEAAAFLNMTPALVKFRAKGLKAQFTGRNYIYSKSYGQNIPSRSSSSILNASTGPDCVKITWGQ